MIIAPAVAGFEKIASRTGWLADLYSLPYKKVLSREIGLAGITDKDSVLNIGCGAIPFSAVYIARITGARVFAVDSDPAAAECAEKCIKTLGLEERISVHNFSGEKPGSCRNFSDASIALVALQARPKRDIIRRLFDECGPGIRVIVRKPLSRLASQYDLLPGEFKVIGSVSQNMKTFRASVLYTGESLSEVVGESA